MYFEVVGCIMKNNSNNYSNFHHTNRGLYRIFILVCLFCFCCISNTWLQQRFSLTKRLSSSSNTKEDEYSAFVVSVLQNAPTTIEITMNDNTIKRSLSSTSPTTNRNIMDSTNFQTSYKSITDRQKERVQTQNSKLDTSLSLRSPRNIDQEGIRLQQQLQQNSASKISNGSVMTSKINIRNTDVTSSSLRSNSGGISSKKYNMDAVDQSNNYDDNNKKVDLDDATNNDDDEYKEVEKNENNESDDEAENKVVIDDAVQCVIDAPVGNEDQCYVSVIAKQPRQVIPDSIDRSIMFVHVGKAGGETIKDAIEFGCQMRNPRKQKKCYANLPTSKLSDHVHSYLHGTNIPVPLQSIHNSTTFLYNLRHPLDRTISWYSFVSPKNCNTTVSKELLGPILPSCRFAHALKKLPTIRKPENGKLNWLKVFFEICFPTLEDFATAPNYATAGSGGGATTTTTTGHRIVKDDMSDDDFVSLSVDCPNIAKQFLLGSSEIQKFGLLSSHMRANYKSYYMRTLKKFPNREVFAVRTNSLWDDLKALDINVLGGTGEFGQVDGSKSSHGSEHHTSSSRTLSSTATQSLCCALQNDIMYYKYLLFAASNLSPEIKQQTWLDDMTRCGFTSWDDLQNQCNILQQQQQQQQSILPTTDSYDKQQLLRNDNSFDNNIDKKIIF
jgi:Sulfotransferase family